MNSYTDAQGKVYDAESTHHLGCEGCAFENDKTTCDHLLYETRDCHAGIVWVERVQSKQNTYVGRDGKTYDATDKRGLADVAPREGRAGMKHTAGPWRWELDEKSKSIALVGGIRTYDLTIMDFERWGMHGAIPRLRDTNPENDGFNLMDRCTKWSTKVPGREHHAAWFKAIDHPDMRLIEAAPDLLASLIELEPYMHEGEKLQRARAAIRKAKGIL